MALSPHIADLEKAKFVETDDGETAVRVQSAIEDDDGNELDINPDGSINIESLSMRGLLCDIIKELKIMNMHNELITNEKIDNRETLR